MIDEDDSCNTTINKLTNDCLHHIFTKLSIRDRLAVENVCRRWKDVSEKGWWDIKKMKISGRRYPSIILHTLDSMWTIKLSSSVNSPFGYFDGEYDFHRVEKSLVLCGRYLHHLTIDTDYIGTEMSNKLVHLVAEHCNNLTHLVLDIVLSSDDMELIFNRCPKLENVSARTNAIHRSFSALHKLPKDRMKQIRLTGCLNHTISSTAATAIRDCPQLRTLIFKKVSFDVESLHIMQHNQSLTKLEFDTCNFDDDAIFSIAHFKNLEHLKIHGVTQILDNLLCRVARNCRKLKYLKITRYFDDGEPWNSLLVKESMIEIAELPFLEELYFENVNLILRDLSTMTSLRILSCPSCRLVSDPAIISLIEHAENLEYLVVTNTRVSKAVLDVADRVTRQRTNGVMLTVEVSYELRNQYQKFSPLLTIQ